MIENGKKYLECLKRMYEKAIIAKPIIKRRFRYFPELFATRLLLILENDPNLDIGYHGCENQSVRFVFIDIISKVLNRADEIARNTPLRTYDFFARDFCPRN